MKTTLTVLASVLLIACTTPRGPLVSKIPGDRREFEIVQVDYRPRQGAATIRFSSSSGIFAFDLNPEARRLKTVTLVVDKQRYCEGLTFRDRRGSTTDLLRLEGVRVSQHATHLIIEIEPPAVNVLKHGGRVHYVNQFR